MPHGDPNATRCLGQSVHALPRWRLEVAGAIVDPQAGILAGSIVVIRQDYPLMSLQEYTDDEIEDFRRMIEGYGLKTTIGG